MIGPKQREAFFKALTLGGTLKDACVLADVSIEWYYDNVKRDKKFLAEVEKARLGEKFRNLARVAQATQRDWKAAAWLLERRHPKEFAQMQKLSGPEGESLRSGGDTDAPLPMLDEKTAILFIQAVEKATTALLGMKSGK
jgi:hypothetical protein